MKVYQVRLPILDRISEMYPCADEEEAKEAQTFHGTEILKKLIGKIETALSDRDDVKLTVLDSIEREGQVLFLIQGYCIGLLHSFYYDAGKDESGKQVWRVSFMFDPAAKGFK